MCSTAAAMTANKCVQPTFAKLHAADAGCRDQPRRRIRGEKAAPEPAMRRGAPIFRGRGETSDSGCRCFERLRALRDPVLRIVLHHDAVEVA